MMTMRITMIMPRTRRMWMTRVIMRRRRMRQHSTAAASTTTTN
jgi:hypothetical protein